MWINLVKAGVVAGSDVETAALGVYQGKELLFKFVETITRQKAERARRA